MLSELSNENLEERLVECIEEEDYSEIIEVTTELINRDPLCINAYRNLLIAADEMGSIGEDRFQKVASIVSSMSFNDSEMLALCADSFFYAGNYLESLKLYEKAMSIDSDNLSISVRLGRLYLNIAYHNTQSISDDEKIDVENPKEKGLGFLIKAISEDSSEILEFSSNANYFLVQYFMGIEDNENALRYAKIGLERTPEDIGLLSQIESIYRDNKDVENALRFGRKLHEIERREIPNCTEKTAEIVSLESRLKQ